MWKLLRPDSVRVLEDPGAKKSLARYFAVMQNKSVAKFQISRKIPAKFSKTSSTDELWLEHARLTEEIRSIERRIHGADSLSSLAAPEKSYFDLKTEIADRIMQNCQFCSRKCQINRVEDELGYCKCGKTMVVSSIFAHFGEEPELVPSGTLFTMGCTMRCKHCQNWTISQWAEKGFEANTQILAKAVEQLQSEGCKNANLVGGDPTPWLSQWLQTFKNVEANVPVVWNSNAYYSTQTAQLLAGFADVYLLDFKYGPGNCAKRISEAPNYWEICTANHLMAKKHGELIVRVLVLPNHLECCAAPILNWIAENLGLETRVNLMFQYTPHWRAYELPEINRKLTMSETKRAIQLAKEAGLLNFII